MKNTEPKIIFVSINKSYGLLSKGKIVKGRETLYECVRKYWYLNSTKKAKEADYIAGVFHGVVQGIYKNSQNWKLVKDMKELHDDDEVKENLSYLERYALDKREEVAEKSIQEKYLGTGFRLLFPVGYNF